jgi:hypothetical protein
MASMTPTAHVGAKWYPSTVQAVVLANMQVPYLAELRRAP